MPGYGLTAEEARDGVDEWGGLRERFGNCATDALKEAPEAALLGRSGVATARLHALVLVREAHLRLAVFRLRGARLEDIPELGQNLAQKIANRSRKDIPERGGNCLDDTADQTTDVHGQPLSSKALSHPAPGDARYENLLARSPSEVTSLDGLLMNSWTISKTTPACIRWVPRTGRAWLISSGEIGFQAR
ncbi:MAG: hypothetical protein VKP72_07400 [bacterium]|nr:hypothetical protein [bacterium]